MAARSYDKDHEFADIAKKHGDHTVMVTTQDSITVWWGEEAYQDIIWSQEDEDKILAGEDPVAEQWEDGCGDHVCEDNASLAFSDYDIKCTAEDLHGSGWKAIDRAEIKDAYDIVTKQYLDKLIEVLEELEAEEAYSNPEVFDQNIIEVDGIEYRLSWIDGAETDIEYSVHRADDENCDYICTVTERMHDDEVAQEIRASIIHSKSRVCTIRADGSASLKVTITELARSMGLGIGDQVRVTIERI